MNTRLALLDYCVRNRLDSSTVKGLWHLAGFDVMPASLVAQARAALAVISALLLGTGLVCAIAANWSNLGRPLQFGMLQAAVLLPCIGAAVMPRMRTGLALFAFIAIGALLAYLGQTYQTGADAWQLFALWSALGLLLVIAVRADTLCIAWVVVAMTAIGLWSGVWQNGLYLAHAANAVVGSIAALALAFLLSRPFQRYTATGPYTSRVAIVAALGHLSMAALPDIINDTEAGMPLLLLFLALLTAFFYAHAASFDLVALCACTLAFNFLLDTAVVSTAMRGSLNDLIAIILLIGTVACGLCGLSIAAILAIMRRQLRNGDSHE